MTASRSTAAAVAAIVLGLAISVVLSLRASMSTGEAAQLAGIATGVTIVGLVVGALVLRSIRRHSLAAQISAIVITTVAAAALGAYVAAERMFISEHDLSVLGVVLVAAAAVAIASALVLGARVATSVDALSQAARVVDLGGGHLRNAGTAPTRELAVLADELHAMEMRLAAAASRERALEASRRELVAWVSHDLRTPLAGMRAMLEAIEDGIVTDAPTKDRYLRTLRDEVVRLGQLVDDLFELSRMDAGAFHLELERVSLSDLVSDALAGSTLIAAAKGVSLEGRVDGPAPEVTVSPPELVRALRNVIENAIRFTPPDGSVVVEVGLDHDEPTCAYVAVRDTGGGVAEEDLPRVFDVAFQSDPARTPGGGAGLGLAIAKRFVEAHHGDLSAGNEDGGARFTLRLPCSAQHGRDR